MFFLFVSYLDDSTWEPVFDDLALAVSTFVSLSDNEDVYSVSLDYYRD